MSKKSPAGPGNVSRAIEILAILLVLVAVVITFTARPEPRTQVPEGVILGIEARRLVGKFGNNVWPGFGDAPPPVFIRVGEYGYLLGHPDPPEEFRKVSNEPEIYRKKGSVLPEPVATAYPIGGKWSVVVPARNKFIRLVREEMGQTGFQLDRFDYVRVVVHESFHAFQLASLGGPEGVPDFGFSGDARDIQGRMRNSRKWREEIIERGKGYFRAIQENSLAGTREILADITSGRKASQLSRDNEILSFEHYLQWLEGTARYAGTRIMMRAGKHSEAKGAEINYKPAEKIRSELLDRLKTPLDGPTPVRDRLAALGAVKAFLLDRIHPGWKTGFFSAKESLDSTLNRAVSVPPPLKDFPVTEVSLAGRKLTVALADNSSRWTHGLQHVNDLVELDGMLFIFPEEVRTGFWMKDTEMALQIGFFGSGGLLEESVTMKPCRTASCPSHTPENPFKYVLELPAESTIRLGELTKKNVEISPAIRR